MNRLGEFWNASLRNKVLMIGAPLLVACCSCAGLLGLAGVSQSGRATATATTVPASATSSATATRTHTPEASLTPTLTLTGSPTRISVTAVPVQPTSAPVTIAPTILPTAPPTIAPTIPPAPTSGERVRTGAQCVDGTTSGATGSGACSSHGGVSCWFYSDGTCTMP